MSDTVDVGRPDPHDVSPVSRDVHPTDIVAEYESGRFVAAFEDKGLPFEWGKAGEAVATANKAATSETTHKSR